MILQRSFEVKEFWVPKQTCNFLHQVIMKNAKTLDKGAIMTEWNFAPFMPIAEWIASKMKELDNCEERLLVTDVFGQYYKIGHYQEKHDHQPAHFSFVLFTNTPEGSSNLCFEDTYIKPETGKVVVFPGDVHHYVPSNKAENRSVVVGNLQYQIREYNS